MERKPNQIQQSQIWITADKVRYRGAEYAWVDSNVTERHFQTLHLRFSKHNDKYVDEKHKCSCTEVTKLKHQAHGGPRVKTQS